MYTYTQYTQRERADRHTDSQPASQPYIHIHTHTHAHAYTHSHTVPLTTFQKECEKYIESEILSAWNKRWHQEEWARVRQRKKMERQREAKEVEKYELWRKKKREELFSAKPHGGRTTRAQNYFNRTTYFSYLIYLFIFIVYPVEFIYFKQQKTATTTTTIQENKSRTEKNCASICTILKIESEVHLKKIVLTILHFD